MQAVQEFVMNHPTETAFAGFAAVAVVVIFVLWQHSQKMADRIMGK